MIFICILNYTVFLLDPILVHIIGKNKIYSVLLRPIYTIRVARLSHKRVRRGKVKRRKKSETRLGSCRNDIHYINIINRTIFEESCCPSYLRSYYYYLNVIINVQN